MSDQQNRHQQTVDVGTPSAGVSTSRRKLVRAGLAAAPVVAAFKTNMVLAQTTGGNVTVRASSFASLDPLAGSVAPTAQTTGFFISLEDAANLTKSKELLFGPSDGKKKGCGFITHFGYPDCESMAKETLKKVFDIKQPTNRQRLAQYLSAGYLAAQQYGDSAYISERTCMLMWANLGEWQPTAGKTWTMAETLQYFDKVYGKASGFSSCLMNPGSCG